MAVPGASLMHLWAPMSRPDPCHTTAAPSRKLDDTRTSDSAPAWMTTTNSLPANNIPEWDWITTSRYKHKRTAVADDTSNSFDAPEWFTPELRSMGAPPKTRRYGKFLLGGTGLVMLKPLVECDTEGVEARPHALEKTSGRPGYIPDADERARLDEVVANAGHRLSVTTSTIIGGGTTGNEFRARKGVTRDRRGLTSAADLDNPSGPIIDAIGSTARGGQAARTMDRNTSVGVRMSETRRARDMGDTVGGGVAGLPVLTMNDGTGQLHVAEPPYASYYAWKRAAQPEEDVYGVPGLNRGRAAQPGRLQGHALYHKMVNTYANKPGQHLVPLREGISQNLSGRTLRTTGQAAPIPALSSAPFNWYSGKR